MDEAMPPDPPAEAPAEQPWCPSVELNGQLLAGVWAVILAACLSAASSLLAMSRGPQPGVTASHYLAWAALLPALWVVVTYTAIGRECGQPSLGRSAGCLLATFALLEVADFATLDLLPLWGQIALWVAFSLGAVAVVAAPFVDRESAPAEAPEPTPSGDTGSKAAVASGILGTLGFGILAAVKLLGKGIGKVFLVRPVVLVFRQLGWEAIVFGGTMLLTACYLIWFAVVKIRSKVALGGFAALLGWCELLGMALGLCVGVWLWIDLSHATDAAAQAAANDPRAAAALPNTMKELIEGFAKNIVYLGLLADVLWASLTVGFFQSLRRRGERARRDELFPDK